MSATQQRAQGTFITAEGGSFMLLWLIVGVPSFVAYFVLWICARQIRRRGAYLALVLVLCAPCALFLNEAGVLVPNWLNVVDGARLELLRMGLAYALHVALFLRLHSIRQGREVPREGRG